MSDFTFQITAPEHEPWTVSAPTYPQAWIKAWRASKLADRPFGAFKKVATCKVIAPFGVSPAFPIEKFEQAKELACQGYSMREICRRVGTHHHHIRPILAQLEAVGKLPSHCPCGLPRGRGHGSLPCTYSTAPKKGRAGPRRSCLSKAQIDEMYALAEQGMSNRAIALKTGRALVTVNKYIKAWLRKREEQGYVKRPCLCGRPARHPGGCRKNTPNTMSRGRIRLIRRWAEEGLSASEMTRRCSGGIEAVLKYARPVWKRMAAEGKFCGCGERLGHVGVCPATWDSGGRVRGPQPIPVDLQKRIATSLLNGDSIVAIRQRLEVSEQKVLRVFRAMTQQERKARSAKVWARLKMGDRDHETALMDRIKAALPRGIDAHIRDDVVAELYLAVLQGDVSIEAIEQRARAYVGKAFNTWISVFGPRSLDAQIGDDSSWSLTDTIEDDTFMQSIEDIDFGSAW